MNYLEEIQKAREAPDKLEELFRLADGVNEQDAFKQAVETCYQESPGSLLLAAWHYRLETLKAEESKSRSINWRWAVLLCLLNGLVFWWLSAPEFTFEITQFPYLGLLAGPIIALFFIAFLVISKPQNLLRALLVSVVLVAITTYAFFLTMDDDGYMMLLLFHLPLLSWGAVGIYVVGLKSSSEDRFAFLIKSIELFVVVGLLLICGVIFAGITVGLFAAVSVEIPEIFVRLMVAGGAGLIPVIAIAITYDPSRPAHQQDFRTGLGRLIATMPRLLLPLALGVLVVYLVVIPFNFLEPFQNRDVLIVYNVMLFAVMGMLLGATPIQPGDLSDRMSSLLRRAIVVVAILVVIVSLYALSAVLYRTFDNYLTMNRLTVIGWNLINTGLLVFLITRLLRARSSDWISSAQGVFSLACALYLVWGTIVVLATPWLF